MGWTGTERVNWFYESNESMSLSLNYILLCNSFALSGIEPVLGMKGPWSGRHQPSSYLVAIITQLPCNQSETLITHLS